MATRNVKRKLVAILAADAVAFSRLMGGNEEQTMRVLNAHRSVIDGIIEYHEGRIVGTAGDSVLAEFGSPTDAVRCAVEIQDALKTRNNSLPEIERLHFRIGINLGDVMIKGDDLLGDGVNIAARLESIAEPGGICISSNIYDHIVGKLDLGFIDIGEQRLKNIPRPIRAYRILSTHARLPASALWRTVHSRRLYGAGAAVVVLAVVAVVLQPRVWPPVTAVSAPEAKAPVPASDSDAQRTQEARRDAEEKNRAEIAAAKARTDAEIAKVQAEANMVAARAGAEVTKLRAEADVAAARAKQQTLPASRASASDPTPSTTTQTEIAATKARADEEIAKIRAEANLAAARAEAEVAKMRAEAAAARAKTPEPPAPQVSASVSGAAPAATAAAPTPITPVRRDGAWIADRLCVGFYGSTPLKDQIEVAVKDDDFFAERGKRGEPDYLVLRGKRGADGRPTLKGHEVSLEGGGQGASRNSQRTMAIEFEGRLEGDRYQLKGKTGGSPCSLTISRS